MITLIEDVRTAATSYVEKGWHVFALAPNAKTPHYHWSRLGYKSATTDLDKINKWCDQGVNLGIACAPSGLIVIDVDYRNEPDFDILEKLPNTYTVGTADGYHLYYEIEPGTYRGKVGDGIDIKYNGYVVAPPSLHPDGVQYKIINYMEPIPFPTKLLSLIVRQS